MKVAIVHEWLVNFRGSERVLLELARMFPDAVLYASVVDKSNIPAELASRDIRTTYINRFPFAVKLYKLYLPFMPSAYEALDLSDYDLVISSSHACAKGVIVAPNATHICYCYTPMRYAWHGFQEYKRSLRVPVLRWVMTGMMHRLRTWDVVSSARVDQFIGCSHEIQRRIQKYYRRDSIVIYPPVPEPAALTGKVGPEVQKILQEFMENPFFLCLGRLVYYKRVDIAVDACTRLNLPLVVAGDGPEYEDLVRRAGPSIRFLRSFTDEEAQALYGACRSFLFPGYEDFGITVVEAQYHGKPVIAYAAGGAMDTVIPGQTGVLFHTQDIDAMVGAIQASTSANFRSEVIRKNATRFSPDSFRRLLQQLTDTLLTKENA